MNVEEISLKELLENSRKQLTKPLTKTRRRLLFFVNITYLLLITIFLVTEKTATGHFVPHPILGVVYGLVGCTNLLSAIYTYRLLSGEMVAGFTSVGGRSFSADWLDVSLRWLSVMSILAMSFCHMVGVGNPSSDALLTDFALGHSLIVLTAMLLGRSASFVWTVTMIGLLAYVAFVDRGYHYQYNYLTPSESARYETALAKQQSWAVERRTELQRNRLNPPTVSRYVDIWFVFILVAFLTAHFCLDTTLAVFKVVPTVTSDIKEAIETTKRQEIEREREKMHVEEQKLLIKQESLNAELKNLKAQLNPHFLYNTLNYFYIKSSELSEDLAEAILKLSDIMRYSMQTNQSEVRLSEEIDYLEQFIALHQLRNENKLCIKFTVAGSPNDKMVIPFLFIGLVENSFKHGKLNDPSSPLIIEITASPDQIKFYSKNLKNKKDRIESNNIGLTNLQRRLLLTYQDNYSFSASQDEDYFSCQLIINT